MNNLGLHALHVPPRLGWKPQTVFSTLQNLVPTWPGPDGASAVCDTFENAVLTTNVVLESGEEFPLTVETKRISLGDKNTWELRAVGLDGAPSFPQRILSAYRGPTANRFDSTKTLVASQRGQQSPAASLKAGSPIPFFRCGRLFSRSALVCSGIDSDASFPRKL